MGPGAGGRGGDPMCLFGAPFSCAGPTDPASRLPGGLSWCFGTVWGRKVDFREPEMEIWVLGKCFFSGRAVRPGHDCRRANVLPPQRNVCVVCGCRMVVVFMLFLQHFAKARMAHGWHGASKDVEVKQFPKM